MWQTYLYISTGKTPEHFECIELTKTKSQRRLVWSVGCVWEPEKDYVR